MADSDVTSQHSIGGVRVNGDMPVLQVWETWKAAGENLDASVVLEDSEGEALAELFFVPPDVAHQLDSAREVQQRLLPRTVPTVPHFDFAGRFVPEGHVGGDYWSVKYYRTQNIVTCKLADVTGHGVAAAILMAAVKFVSGVLFRYSSSPAEVMERTNHSLLRETAPERMATMVYAWVYPETSRVRLVNAGHFPAFRCDAADGKITDVPATGPLLGLIETGYEEIEWTLTPGDLLFFCSDGVAEAGDPVQFGEARVKEIVREHRHQSADQIADAVLQAAHDCCGPVRDDMSLVVIRARPTETLPSLVDISSA